MLGIYFLPMIDHQAAAIRISELLIGAPPDQGVLEPMGQSDIYRNIKNVDFCASDSRHSVYPILLII